MAHQRSSTCASPEQLATYFDLGDTAQVDIWIASKATESIGATDSVPESRVGAAAGTPGVAWSAPVVLGMGRVTRPDGVRECVSVLGVKAPRYAGLPSRLAPGTSQDSLRGSSRILLNDNDRPSCCDLDEHFAHPHVCASGW